MWIDAGSKLINLDHVLNVTLSMPANSLTVQSLSGGIYREESILFDNPIAAQEAYRQLRALTEATPVAGLKS